MKKKPYVGVTGFMSSEEVTETLKDIDFKTANRLLMVGVLASSKTIQGIKNKWPNRYPPLHEIGNIFVKNDDCLNLIHYNTKDPDKLLTQLIMVSDAVNDNFDGFQLNIAWPPPQILENYKSLYPCKQIVLQIGGGAFEEAGNMPAWVANKVAEYVGIVDYILLDPSGGLGQPSDPLKAREYLDELSRYEKEIGLGVAGGLSPNTLHLLEPLLQVYPSISIDAEGKLRNEQDHLDVAITRKYIQQSLHMFSMPV